MRRCSFAVHYATALLSSLTDRSHAYYELDGCRVRLGCLGAGSFAGIGRSLQGRGEYGDDRNHSSILFILPMSPNAVRGHILVTCANEAQRRASFCLCQVCKQRWFVPHSLQDGEAADGHHLSKNGLNMVKKCKRQCRFPVLTFGHLNAPDLFAPLQSVRPEIYRKSHCAWLGQV